jgi:hypothetical protein
MAGAGHGPPGIERRLDLGAVGCRDGLGPEVGRDARRIDDFQKRRLALQESGEGVGADGRAAGFQERVHHGAAQILGGLFGGGLQVLERQDGGDGLP